MKKRLNKTHREVVLKVSDFLKDGDFYLAGGTAVYYYLNHRVSEDLDFFTKEKIDFREWKNIFENSEILELSEDTIHTLIDKLKILFFYYPYDLLRKRIQFDLIELASLEDILAMKASAIIQRGSKKDFIDVYYIMKILKYDSHKLISLFQQKYGKFNPLILKKAFVYFEDADKEPELRMIKPTDWKEVKEFFIKEFVEV
ncbi:MAG: nucleotidyl transferase AbiEii/AbiGii toxin family protein [Thermodesulfovibrio sp.]|nr:nucleotidyl transferase AbiEii/AbiGii toxin family protein [Thermodesulfovibrio sp.]